jgi:DNA-binding NarL/FixJ family response regulator
MLTRLGRLAVRHSRAVLLGFLLVFLGLGAYGALAALTEREREVMALVGIGLSNEEIARRLVVSPLTAKTHVSRTMVKLGARDRAQLVVLAYESGLVRPGWLG